jgi:hypothetical protein
MLLSVFFNLILTLFFIVDQVVVFEQVKPYKSC